MIASSSGYGPDYMSGIAFAHRDGHLHEAKSRAIAKGLMS